MKALTLTQPWASLVAIGAKKIETRSWYTAHRGPLAIHAGKGFADYAPAFLRVLIRDDPFRSALQDAGYMSFDDLPRGAIVATCTLISCVLVPPHGQVAIVRGGASRWVDAQRRYDGVRVPPLGPEFYFGDYHPGRYAWMLNDIKRLPEPVPARGAQGLWDWDGR